MRVYIFTPVKNWAYCGGAIAVVARSPQEAAGAAMALPYYGCTYGEHGATFYIEDVDVQTSIPNEVDSWYLHYTSPPLDMPEGPARVVVNDWNYS